MRSTIYTEVGADTSHSIAIMICNELSANAQFSQREKVNSDYRRSFEFYTHGKLVTKGRKGGVAGYFLLGIRV
jgi:hypothetical protein